MNNLNLQKSDSLAGNPSLDSTVSSVITPILLQRVRQKAETV